MNRSREEFFAKESDFKGRYSARVFQTIWYAYRPYWKRVALLSVLGLSGRILLLSTANLTGAWADRHFALNGPSDPAALAADSEQFMMRLALLLSLGFVLTWTFRVFFSRASVQAVSHLYDEVTVRVSRFPMRFFDTQPTGRIVTRFSSDYSGILRLFGGPLGDFLALIFDLAAMMVLLIGASPWFSILVCILALGQSLIWRAQKTSIRRGRREMASVRSPSIAHFSEISQGAAVIRAFGREKMFIGRFAELYEPFLKSRQGLTRSINVFQLSTGGLTAIMILLTGLFSLLLLKFGLVQIGAVGVAFTFITLSSTSIQMLFDWLTQFEEAMSSVERLDDYLRRPLEIGAFVPESARFPIGPFRNSKPAEGLPDRPATAGRIDINHLWFRYEDLGPWILKDIDFQITPGERIGILGRTGSGKSSLASCLMGLYPLDRGGLTIDGVDPASSDIEEYRRLIAYISQDPILLRGTLRDNLDLSGKISEDRLIEALHQVGLEPWLQSHAKGLNFSVEERGRNLSIGERQLLCLARCALQPAPVVLMDEPTSSVDPRSEMTMVRATEQVFRGTTQIIIAHRLSTLADCDRVLWLDEGRIRQVGSPIEITQAFQLG